MPDSTSLATHAALRDLLEQSKDIDSNIQLAQDELSDVRTFALARIAEVQAALLARVDAAVTNICARLPLVGGIGPQGFQGVQGFQGIQGVVGPQGFQGVNGNAFTMQSYEVPPVGSFAAPYVINPADASTFVPLTISFTTGPVAGPCLLLCNVWIACPAPNSDPNLRSRDYDFHMGINGKGQPGESHINDFMGSASIQYCATLLPNTQYIFTMRTNSNGSPNPLSLYQARMQIVTIGYAFVSSP